MLRFLMKHLDKARLQQLINEGLDPEEIAKKYGQQDVNIIYYMLRMYGITPKQKNKTNLKIKMAVGLDVGTSRLLSARNEDNKIVLKAQRNAFLKLPGDSQTTRALKRLQVNHIQLDDGYYIVGDDAFNYAHVFPTTLLRRPMASGMLNPTEPDSFLILRALIENLIGAPRTAQEVCVYSIPAPPVDVDKLTQYHSDIIGEIVKSLGFNPFPLNEGVALGTTGLEDYDLTGLALCFGGGLVNAALLYKGLSALQLSVTKAGDFIDENAAKDTGKAKVHITGLKEDSTLDISVPQTTREGQAIKTYYLLAIRHALQTLANKFQQTENMPHFPKAIPVALGGGGVLIKGFAKLFEQEFNALKMPFELVTNGIIIVNDSLSAVARGCLSEALLDE